MNERLLARRGLSLERLENFCRVAETGGITKAAGGDPAKQSLYSRQIRELEEFFGAELIQRDGRGIRLTSTGRRLARLVREQFAALIDFQQETNAAPVSLSIGAGNSVLEWLLTPLLPRLRKELPSIEVALLNKRTHDIVRDLQELKLDIGIVRADAVEGRLKTAAFCRLDYGLFVPEAWTRGVSDAELLKRLSDRPFALMADGTFRQQFDEVARREKMRVRVAVSCSSFTQAAELLESGEFAAVLPTTCIHRLHAQSSRQVTLPGLARCGRKLVLAWNPRLTTVRPVVDQAVEILKSAVAA
jgi:DNA-binding transcriptional LysR family regulator